MRRTYSVMGVEFVDTSFEGGVGQLSRALRGPHGQTAFFANAATLNIACEDCDYRRALNSADHMMGDGTGVRWAARVRGVRLRANLNGTDLMPAVIEANPGIRVYLLGGTGALIEAAAARFPSLFPNAVLAGSHHGYFDHGDCTDVIEAINGAKPDLLLVGFGNPLQEKWICEHRSRLAVPLIAGVGGLFSYWAGTLDRASSLYRSLGFEWLHILRRQPHKLKRYTIGNARFLMHILTWLHHDAAGRPMPAMARRVLPFGLIAMAVVGTSLTVEWING